MQVTKMKAALEKCSSKFAKEHRKASVFHSHEPADTKAKKHGTTPLIDWHESAGRLQVQWHHLAEGGKLYSEAVGGHNSKRFKVTVTSKGIHSP
jgi:hypothetical protein